jgi:glutaconyl-CoA/methylmalonyl-CoA decarboxylase subunit delta
MDILIILLSAAQTNSAEEFVKLDPYGVGMAAMAMLVVISVLAFAAITFQNIENLINFFTKFFSKKPQVVDLETKKEKVSTSGDEIAAIAMALHLYKSELHDTESLKLTMNKISRVYSPWSSKIYGIMNKAVKPTPYSK